MDGNVHTRLRLSTRTHLVLPEAAVISRQSEGGEETDDVSTDSLLNAFNSLR